MFRQSQPVSKSASPTTTETSTAASAPQKFTSEGAIPGVGAAPVMSRTPTASEKAYDSPPSPEQDQDAKLNVVETELTHIERMLARPNPKPADLQAMQAALEAWRDRADSLGDLSDEMSIQLQMYMERLAKADAMLSNLMKKSSETSSGIVANMK